MFSLTKFFVALVGVYVVSAGDAEDLLQNVVSAGDAANDVGFLMAKCAMVDGYTEWSVKEMDKKIKKNKNKKPSASKAKKAGEKYFKNQGKVAKKFKKYADDNMENKPSLKDCKKMHKMLYDNDYNSCSMFMTIAGILIAVIVLGVVGFMMCSGKKSEGIESSEDSQY